MITRAEKVFVALFGFYWLSRWLFFAIAGHNGLVAPSAPKEPGQALAVLLVGLLVLILRILVLFVVIPALGYCLARRAARKIGLISAL